MSNSLGGHNSIIYFHFIDGLWLESGSSHFQLSLHHHLSDTMQTESHLQEESSFKKIGNSDNYLQQKFFFNW